MKTLYIARHAKSSWDHPELIDEQRPLLEKGIKKTGIITDYLIDNNISVDLIISSHAVRALETAKIIAKAIHYPEDEIIINEHIYFSDIDDLTEQLSNLSDQLKSVMIVGHNPTLTDFANYLLEKKIDWLPTSGIVSINFKTQHWLNLLDARKTTNFIIYPGLLKKSRNK